MPAVASLPLPFARAVAARLADKRVAAGAASWLSASPAWPVKSVWAETILWGIVLGFHVACDIMNNIVLRLHCRALSLGTPLEPGLNYRDRPCWLAKTCDSSSPSNNMNVS